MKKRRPNIIKDDEYYFSEPTFYRNNFIIEAGSKEGTRKILMSELTAVDAMRIMLCKGSTQVGNALRKEQKIQSFTDLQEVLNLCKTMKNTCILQIEHYLPIIDPINLYGAALLTTEYKRRIDKEENVLVYDIVDRLAKLEQESESEQ